MKKLFMLMSCLLLASSAFADWDPGDTCKMHYPQLPDPQGWDVCLCCQMIADDFVCSETGDITDIHFWISWNEDRIGELTPGNLSVSIWSDATGKPGMQLWSFTHGSMAVRYYGQGPQGWICPTGMIAPNNHLQYYQVNLTNLTNPFTQRAGTTYWLVIKANLFTPPWPQGPAVGWKTTFFSQQFQSRSHWSIDGMNWTPVGGGTVEIWDQAFVITNDGQRLDFGDAPDPIYPTLRISNGARHIIRAVGPWLGDGQDRPDAELDGQPTVNAMGDDINNMDDEDGVQIPPLTIGQPSPVTFQVSSSDGNGGMVYGWIDFNNNGIWGDIASEQVVSSNYTNGNYTVMVTPPAGSVVGVTYARFRISRDPAGNFPTGMAADGEVEDHRVEIKESIQFDFGDAPDPIYATLLASNGARHIIRPVGPWLGDQADNPDSEANGQQSPNANGDDINGYDDEDGVIIPPLTIGQMSTITFEVNSGDSGGGMVYGWIDFNGNGIWNDIPVEQIVATGYPNGIYNINVVPPPGSIVGPTFARFRISRDPAGNFPTGLAQDGEVEDYPVTIKKEPEPDRLDFGDAPEGGIAYPATGIPGQFPTCITVGPSAWIQHTNFGAFFGPVVDFELDGNAGACPGCFPPYDQDECFQDGDAGLLIPTSYTISGGVVVPCTGVPGPPLGMTCQNASWGANIDIQVRNNMPGGAVGFVNVLIDWDQNGMWAGGSICPMGPAPEHVLVDFPIPNGFNGPLSALLPPPFIIGPNANYVWARISITERQVGPGWAGDGQFEDGETEDYLLQVLPDIPPEDRDFGDAPDQPYPTLLVNNGAYHVIVPTLYMGIAVDAETDGQPTTPANGDDINPAAGTDDEDGVVFLTAPLVAGFPAQVQITASANGFIDAWIDFEKNGDWANPLEQIFASKPVVAGLNTLTFNVPTGLGGGVSSPVSYARFRFSTAGGLSYTGAAGDGEVEDYHVLVEGEIENAADLGDAPDSTNNMLTAMTAYTGVQANFPTVYIDGSGTTPHGPIHLQSRKVAYLGGGATLEVEADSGPDEDLVNNINPTSDIPDLDNSDDGVSNMPLHLPYCSYTTFDYKITVAPSAANQILYVNAWFDWNRDGDWDDVLSPVCLTKQADEWAVQNQVFIVSGPGQYTITSSPFLSWHPILAGGTDEIWMRVTLSEKPWSPTASIVGDGGSGPAGGYKVGETEDYLFVPDTSCIRCADLNCDGTVNLSDFAIFASRWLATCP